LRSPVAISRARLTRLSLLQSCKREFKPDFSRGRTRARKSAFLRDSHRRRSRARPVYSRRASIISRFAIVSRLSSFCFCELLLIPLACNLPEFLASPLSPLSSSSFVNRVADCRLQSARSFYRFNYRKPEKIESVNRGRIIRSERNESLPRHRENLIPPRGCAFNRSRNRGIMVSRYLGANSALIDQPRVLRAGLHYARYVHTRARCARHATTFVALCGIEILGCDLVIECRSGASLWDARGRRNRSRLSGRIANY